MTQTPDNGGPAFPTTAKGETTSGRILNYEGMTLRDWFAGQALAGYIAHLGAQNIHASNYTGECSSEAYMFADAMLAARKGAKT